MGVLQSSVSPIAKPKVSDIIFAPGYNLSLDKDNSPLPFSQTHKPGFNSSVLRYSA
jgi:hypothetical protein